MRRTLIVLALAGCAGTTDVVSTGGDTFMVASHGTMGWSSGPAQKAHAIERANAYCSVSGKTMEILNASEQPGGFGRIAAGEVQFRCVSPASK